MNDQRVVQAIVWTMPAVSSTLPRPSPTTYGSITAPSEICSGAAASAIGVAHMLRAIAHILAGGISCVGSSEVKT